MKARSPLARPLLYLGGVLALILAFYLYVLIPRPLGEVRLDGVRLVSDSAIRRLDNALLVSPRKWLRVELSSEQDLIARQRAVAGNDDLYPRTSFCRQRDPSGDPPLTRGLFPDDLPQFVPAGGYRHAARKADGRFHYTVYLDAEHPGDGRDLCLQIKGSRFFGPAAESRVITVPNSIVQKSRERGLGS